jgi:hypothetical protein
VFSRVDVRDRAAAIVFAYDHEIVEPTPVALPIAVSTGRCRAG